MNETPQVLLGWIAFGGTHILLSHGSIRASLSRKLGPMGFKGLYSLVALATFAFLVFSYFPHRHAGPLWWDLRTAPGAVRFVELLMLVSFILIVAAFITPSPTGMDPRGRHEPRGVLRITRHPFTMGAAIFGIAHCIPNGFGSDLAFFGGFALFSIIGAFHQDARKQRDALPEERPFFDETSVIPFAAILRGRQSFKPRELSWIGVLVAVVLAIVIRLLHARWFGIPGS
jgi:uncharacterized membrane protein